MIAIFSKISVKHTLRVYFIVIIKSVFGLYIYVYIHLKDKKI